MEDPDSGRMLREVGEQQQKWRGEKKQSSKKHCTKVRRRGWKKISVVRAQKFQKAGLVAVESERD
jgi:hypothetical protein